MPRCPARHPETNKQCVLIPNHKPGHRWWQVYSDEYPTWNDGKGRIEWFDEDDEE